jgi:hypothetical protein
MAHGGADWRSTTFDNQTPYDVWAKKSEGTLRLKFRYTGATVTAMLCQFTGKDRSYIDDTNDAIRCYFSQIGAALVYGGNNGLSETTLAMTATISADAWHTLEIKWRKTGPETLSLTIDGTTVTSTDALTDMSCTAIHHLLIGNDTYNAPEGLWIDNVEVFGSWQA